MSRVVAITGGARGIGLAMAAAFRAAGYTVATGDLDGELAAATAAPLGAHGLPLDVTDRASFAAFLDAVERAHGPLDVLVNNAGIMPTGRFLDEPDALTDRMLEINLRGVLTGTRLAATRFAARGSGTVVNVASLAGVTGFPGVATYCATKHAVVGLGEALHNELRASGVGVLTVLPGVVRTELSAGARTPRWSAALSTVDPEDVARAVVRAVATGRRRVTVPRRLGAVLAVVGVLPAPLKAAAFRVTGADTAYTQADPAARARYHARILP